MIRYYHIDRNKFILPQIRRRGKICKQLTKKDIILINKKKKLNPQEFLSIFIN